MVIHCIRCVVLNLTKYKQEALDNEYSGFQWWMQFGIDIGILSQHKRAKGHYYKKEQINYKEYPLIIPHNQMLFRKKDTKLTPYWIKVSVRKRKGIGVWLPIKPRKQIPDIKYLKDSMLVMNKKGNYELRLHFDIPQIKIIPKSIIAIDLGERVIATVCDSKGNKLFLGRNIRGIRRHYAWLRKVLGQRKLLKKIRQIGQKEKNIVKNELHLTSNQIIDLAKKNKSIIVIGQFNRKKTRSKRLNRIVFNMPYHALITMIKYKAEQSGIQVFMVDEKYSSITCHKCGNIDKKQRKSQGLFSCSHCGLQYNADLNGAMNNLKRAEEQCFLAGAIAEAQKPVAIAN